MSDQNRMVEGTSISKDRFAAMLAHSTKINEDCAPSPGQEMSPSITGVPLSATISNVTGGDYQPDQVEPIGKMPGEETPEDERVPDQPVEQLDRDLALLFAEGEDDKKDGEASDDDKVYGDEDDEDEKDDDDEDDDEQEECAESVALHCAKCGFEDEYSLNEEDLAQDPPPMKDGQLDPTCPMCGADMDMSLIGATDQEQITDPNPIAGPRGEGGTDPVGESELTFARELVGRVLEGEDPEVLAQLVIEADFMPTV